MKFMMLVMTDEAPDAVGDESDVQLWVDELDERGVRLIGDVLDPGTATTVRVRDGSRLVTDGPSAATSALWGFDILECADLAEALDVAARHPMARNGRLELRPFPAA